MDLKRDMQTGCGVDSAAQAPVNMVMKLGLHNAHGTSTAEQILVP